MDDDSIREIFDGLGPVTIRRMFGGKGIYHRGLIVAVVLGEGELMIKGDAASGPEIEAAGGRRWVYEMKGRAGKMPYWTIPEAALDDPEELTIWTRKAYEAAVRSQAAKLAAPSRPARSAKSSP